MQTKKAFVGFGEIMLRLQTNNYERFTQARNYSAFFTGAETNVAISLANYGIPSYIVSQVPDSDIGQASINFIRSFGVNTNYILRSGNRLGLFYSETGSSQRPSKVIYDRARSAVTELVPGQIDWEGIFFDKSWFHFTGITAALSDTLPSVIQEACECAKRYGVTISCDLNYRKKLWTREKANRVMRGLMEFVDVLVCNEEDAEMVFGIEAHGSDVSKGKLNSEKYMEVAIELVNQFKFKIVAITLRESISASINNWSGILFDTTDFYKSKKYEITPIVDRVGGGDSFAGGLIFGLMEELPLSETIEFAIAASCLKHTIPGDFNLVSEDEVRALMLGGGSGRIQR